MSKHVDELKPGLTGTAEMLVTEAHTAASMGSGRLPILATPALIALMEAAAQHAVASCLSIDHQSVGTYISVRHEGATPVGMKVFATAELTTVEGRTLRFRLRAKDEFDEIATGDHERSISSIAVFTRLLRQKKERKNA